MISCACWNRDRGKIVGKHLVGTVGMWFTVVISWWQLIQLTLTPTGWDSTEFSVSIRTSFNNDPWLICQSWTASASFLVNWRSVGTSHLDLSDQVHKSLLAELRGVILHMICRGHTLTVSCTSNIQKWVWVDGTLLFWTRGWDRRGALAPRPSWGRPSYSSSKNDHLRRYIMFVSCEFTLRVENNRQLHSLDEKSFQKPDFIGANQGIQKLNFILHNLHRTQLKLTFSPHVWELVPSTNATVILQCHPNLLLTETRTLRSHFYPFSWHWPVRLERWRNPWAQRPMGIKLNQRHTPKGEQIIELDYPCSIRDGFQNKKPSKYMNIQVRHSLKKLPTPPGTTSVLVLQW